MDSQIFPQSRGTEGVSMMIAFVPIWKRSLVRSFETPGWFSYISCHHLLVVFNEGRIIQRVTNKHILEHPEQPLCPLRHQQELFSLRVVHLKPLCPVHFIPFCVVYLKPFWVAQLNRCHQRILTLQNKPINPNRWQKKASRLHCGLLFHSYANCLCCLFYWVMFFLVFDDDFRYQTDIWSLLDKLFVVVSRHKDNHDSWKTTLRWP